MSVPVPPKKITIAEDKRNAYLQRWKDLFEAINPEIRVVLNDTDGRSEVFYEEWKKIVGHIWFDGFDYSDAYILVIFPRAFNPPYLVGLPHDEMFSRSEIDNDELYQSGDEHLCDPETKKWEEWYQEVCKQFSNINTSVPIPPNEKAGN